VVYNKTSLGFEATRKMGQRPVTRRSRLALLDIMGAILPGAVVLMSLAPFSGADATLVAAVLTVATYCMVFRNPR
jgi:hypothetical protein